MIHILANIPAPIRRLGRPLGLWQVKIKAESLEHFLSAKDQQEFLAEDEYGEEWLVEKQEFLDVLFLKE